MQGLRGVFRLSDQLPATEIGPAALRRRLLALAAMTSALGLIAIGVVVVYQLTLRDPHGLTFNPWALSEWLINYDAGFIRRGLAGALLRRIGGGHETLPLVNALAFYDYAALATLVAALILLSPKARPAVAFMVSVAPAGVVMMALSNQFFYRKEMLFHICLAAAAVGGLLARRSASRLAVVLFLFFASLVLPLVHESFLFLSAPAAVLLLSLLAGGAEPGAGRLRAGAAGLYLAIAVAVFLTMAWFGGNRQAAQTIWNGLNPLDATAINPTGQIYGGIDAIGWSLRDAVMLPATMVRSGLVWYWLVPIGGSAVYCLALVALSVDTFVDGASAIAEWANVYGLLLLASAPMYLLGWDWGRWTSATSNSFLILFLALGDRPRWPPWFARVSERITPYTLAYCRWLYRHRIAVAALSVTFTLTSVILEGGLGADTRGKGFLNFALHMARLALDKLR